MTTFGALRGAGGQKHLQRRMGKDHCAHVAAIGQEARQALETVLQRHQSSTHSRLNRHFRSNHTGLLGANRVTHVLIAQLHGLALKTYGQGAGEVGNAGFVVGFQRQACFQSGIGRHAVERA